MTVYRITKIEPQKRFPNRRNIYLNEAFAFGLDEAVVLKSHLHEGDEISEETIQNILMEEEMTHAKQKALALLSYRARSIFEIRDRLTQKGYEERIIHQIIEDFKRVGLLDDELFASTYIQSRMIQRPVGKRLLIRELKQKGIEESLVIQMVDEYYGNLSEIAVAKSLVEQRLKRYQADPPVKVRKKISDFLVRRGFDWEIIGEVMEWIETSKRSDISGPES